MTTETEIANRALQKIGAKRITAFGESTTKEGREVSAAWDLVRKSELRRYNWNFAMTRAALPASTDAPEWGFDQCFELPAGCLRLVDVEDLVEGRDYQRENLGDADHTQIIVCDSDAPLNIRFIRDVENVAVWDASFVDAFAAKLATELAMTLADSPTRKQLGDAGYREAIREAQRSDAIENPPDDRLEDDWNLARL